MADRTSDDEDDNNRSNPFAQVKLKGRDAPTLELKPLKWDNHTTSWQQLELTPVPTSTPLRSLVVLTFNIMKEQDLLQRRMEALLAIIEKYNPDFVALQENTHAHNAFFLQSLFVRKHYYISDFSGQTHGFKTSLWSKLPPTKLTKLEPLGRPAIVGLYDIGGEKLSVGCVHLTSNAAGNCSDTRQKQIDITYQEQLKLSYNVITMGDFNAASRDTALVSQHGFVDAWLAVRGHSKYLDKVAVHMPAWKVMSVEVIGEENISPPGEKKLLISDHVGLVAYLKKVQ